MPHSSRACLRYQPCNCTYNTDAHPWQACNPSHGDVWSFEFMHNGKFVLEAPAWTTLPPQCKVPSTPKGDILCTVAFSVSKGDGLVPTLREPSQNVSLGDNCGTQVIDIWVR